MGNKENWLRVIKIVWIVWLVILFISCLEGKVIIDEFIKVYIKMIMMIFWIERGRKYEGGNFYSLW